MVEAKIMCRKLQKHSFPFKKIRIIIYYRWKLCFTLSAAAVSAVAAPFPSAG